jgi:6-phosphogluconolactonase
VGSGPRHLAFHPAGEFAYVAGELDSTVTTCRWSDGMLSILESSSTLLSGESTYSNYPGEIAVSKDGRFVYVTNRGSNTVAVFAVHDDGERLELLATPASGGDWPRHLAIDDSGRWLYVANERSGELAWFPLDPETGLPGELAGTLPVPGVTQILLTRP